MKHFLSKIIQNIRLRDQNVRDILILCSIALAARLHFFLSIKSDPTFLMPIVDSLEFDIWAYKISQGQWLWVTLSNHPPLYAYFVGFIYRFLGYSPARVAIFQYFMFAFSIGLIYLVAKRYFNRLTAWGCCIFMGTYWFFIYLNSFLFSENLSVFLNVLLIYILLYHKDVTRKYCIAGIILGLSSICRPQILPFSIGIICWIFLKKMPRLEKTKYVLVFLSGVLFFNSLVFFQNYRISDQLLLRLQTGANLYMGNSPEFKGTNIYVKIGKEWDEFISQPHNFYKRNVTESESNKYFVGKTLKIIEERPLEWARLILAKTFSIWTGREYLRTEDVYIFDLYFLRTFYGFVSTRLIFLLALLGFIYAGIGRLNLTLIYILIVTMMAPISFFPIKTRYLISLFPFIMMFSSYALVRMYHMLKERDMLNLTKGLSALFLLIAVSFYNPLNITYPTTSETFHAIGINYRARGRADLALKCFETAIQMEPQNVTVYNDVGLYYMGQGDYLKAMDVFKKALDIDPSMMKAQLNYDLCLKQLNKIK